MTPKKIGTLTIYSVKELSKKLGVTPLTLRTYIRQGKLKGQKLGGQWYVSEEALREFFKVPGDEGYENHD